LEPGRLASSELAVDRRALVGFYRLRRLLSYEYQF
jgi:hypothetical protein